MPILPVSPHPSAVVLDFDFTLSHFVGTVNSYFEIFTGRRIDPIVVKEASRRAEEEGFTIMCMLRHIERMAKPRLNPETIGREFGAWLGRNLALYNDTMRVVRALKATGAEVIIATFGNTWFQHKKVKMTEVPHDILHVTSEPNTKWRVVKKVLTRHSQPVLFVDDKPSELDAVRDAGIDTDAATTVLIRRPDGPYRDVVPKHPHQTVDTLSDIVW